MTVSGIMTAAAKMRMTSMVRINIVAKAGVMTFVMLAWLLLSAGPSGPDHRVAMRLSMLVQVVAPVAAMRP